MCVMQRSAKFPFKAILGSTKVVDFGIDRKRVFDFLLIINSNFVVSCTVTEIWGRKSPICTYPTLIQRPRSGWPPSNIGMNVISRETRIMGLSYGEEIVIVGRTMWTQSTSVSDRQTDRQADRITITKTVQRIASHGKNGSTLSQRQGGQWKRLHTT